MKMKKVFGRSDDMLIISGVNVFPSQIESILLEVPAVEPQYVLIIRKKGYLDALSVDVEAKPEVYDQGDEKLREVEKEIEGKIRGVIGIGVKVRCVPPKSIERSEGQGQAGVRRAQDVEPSASSKAPQSKRPGRPSKPLRPFHAVRPGAASGGGVRQWGRVLPGAGSGVRCREAGSGESAEPSRSTSTRSRPWCLARYRARSARSSTWCAL